MSSTSISSSRLRRILRGFLVPRAGGRGGLRLAAVAAAAALFFRFICRPALIRGGSMLPTYPERGFVLCWRPAYWFSGPDYGDVVVMRYGSARTLLLKRLVGKAGDTIEFRNGVLFRNGIPREEPYVRRHGDWNLPPRCVEKDHLYVVGDNRSVPMDAHVFGQMHRRFLEGRPAW